MNVFEKQVTGWKQAKQRETGLWASLDYPFLKRFLIVSTNIKGIQEAWINFTTQSKNILFRTKGSCYICLVTANRLYRSAAYDLYVKKRELTPCAGDEKSLC